MPGLSPKGARGPLAHSAPGGDARKLRHRKEGGERSRDGMDAASAAAAAAAAADAAAGGGNASSPAGMIVDSGKG